MQKKGSMELSVNSIVILVIAVVMMGLILGFIRTKFSDISKDILSDEPPAPEASSSDPITMSRTTIVASAAKKTALKLNFFNTNLSEMKDANPIFQCKSSSLTITDEYFSKTAKSGEMVSFEGTIKTSAVPKDTYICKLCFVGYTGTSPNGNAPTDCDTTIMNTWLRSAPKEFTLIIQ